MAANMDLEDHHCGEETPLEQPKGEQPYIHVNADGSVTFMTKREISQKGFVFKDWNILPAAERKPITESVRKNEMRKWETKRATNRFYYDRVNQARAETKAEKAEKRREHLVREETRLAKAKLNEAKEKKNNDKRAIRRRELGATKAENLRLEAKKAREEKNKIKSLRAQRDAGSEITYAYSGPDGKVERKIAGKVTEKEVNQHCALMSQCRILKE